MGPLAALCRPLLTAGVCPLSPPQVCYALSQLAAGFYEQRGTSPMSPYFKDVVQALLETVRARSSQRWNGCCCCFGLAADLL